MAVAKWMTDAGRPFNDHEIAHFSGELKMKQKEKKTAKFPSMPSVKII